MVLLREHALADRVAKLGGSTARAVRAGGRAVRARPPPLHGEADPGRARVRVRMRMRKGSCSGSGSCLRSCAPPPPSTRAHDEIPPPPPSPPPAPTEHYLNITHQTLEVLRVAAADPGVTHVLKVRLRAWLGGHGAWPLVD